MLPLFLIGKLLRVVTTLLGVALIMFLLMHAIPGTPWSNYSSSPRLTLNLAIDKPLQRELSRRFGLDLPLWRQYTRYIVGDVDERGDFFCGVVCGNLGPSIQQRGRSVSSVLFDPPEGMTFWESRFGYSIRLVLLATLIAFGLGVPLGIASATKRKSTLGTLISVGLAALLSIPNFVIGLLTIIVFAVGLKLINVLPDWDNPNSWIIPALVLAIVPMAGIARITRASLMNILSEDYIRTAHSKGLRQTRVTFVHVLPNALVPVVTYLGVVLMEMFTGLLIVENLYAFPGFGREYWGAVLNLDYPMILGLTLVYATGIVFINLVIGVLCEILDPRLRVVRA